MPSASGWHSKRSGGHGGGNAPAGWRSPRHGRGGDGADFRDRAASERQARNSRSPQVGEIDTLDAGFDFGLLEAR